MTNRGRVAARPRRVGWSLRAMIAFVALVGIVAMHGLTMNHNTTMATMAAEITTVTAHATNHTMTSSESIPDSAALGVPTVHGTTDMAADTAVMSHLMSPHSMGEMATACVAFLTGMLLLMAAGLTLIRTVRYSDARRPLPTLRWISAVADRLRPDLAQLSVLRT